MPTAESVFNLNVPSLECLAFLSAVLAETLLPGDVVLLDGMLGAGKTTTVQHICQAMGVQEKVTSPTFVLTHEYVSGRVPVLHADLYRLGPAQAPHLEEVVFSATDAVVLVEWAEYGEFLQQVATVNIRIDFLEPEGRLFRIETEKSALKAKLSEFRCPEAANG